MKIMKYRKKSEIYGNIMKRKWRKQWKKAMWRNLKENINENESNEINIMKAMKINQL